jgi:hypothetical protein
VSLRSDLPNAVIGAWLVVSVIAFAAAAAPLLLPAEALYGLFPECEAKARGGGCAMCGMTTGFLLIASGDLEGARAANAGAPFLYFTFLANFLAAVAYSTLRLLRRHSTGDHHTCNSSV